MSELSPRARTIVLTVIVVVTAFVVATLFGLGGSDGTASPPTTTRPAPPPTTTSTTTTPPPPTTAVPGFVVPAGDYTEVCRQLESAVPVYPKVLTVESFRTVFEALDVDALGAVAPQWLQPYIQTLRAERAEVLAALQDPKGFDPKSVSLEFYDAIGKVGAVVTQECGIEPG